MQESKPFTSVPHLTDREREIASLLCEGEPNAAIARRLGISEQTVKNTLNRLYAKLGVVNRAQTIASLMRSDELGGQPSRGGINPNTSSLASPIIETISSLRYMLDQLEARLDQLVHAARAYGVPWHAVGEALGVSRQAVQQRYRNPSKGDSTRTAEADSTGDVESHEDVLRRETSVSYTDDEIDELLKDISQYVTLTLQPLVPERVRAPRGAERPVAQGSQLPRGGRGVIVSARKQPQLGSVERLTSVPAEVAQRFLSLYRASSAPLEALAPARQALTDEEFLLAMDDPSVVKFVGWNSDHEARAMSVLATDLQVVPWISVPYFQARFPDHYERGAIYYFYALLVEPEDQGGPWARLVLEELTRMVASNRAVAAFECCDFTADVTKLPEMIARVANRLSYVDPIELDHQHYYGYVLQGLR